MKFKPCPFCGSPDIFVLPQKEGRTMIRCEICGANKTVFTEFDEQKEAEWNNRRLKAEMPDGLMFKLLLLGVTAGAIGMGLLQLFLPTCV